MYHTGPVYDFRWIQDSIKNEKVLPNEPYLLTTIDNQNEVVISKKSKNKAG
jgi:hypothetical protein